MNKQKNILKNTFKFVGSFILMSIIFVLIFGTTIMFVPTGQPTFKYAPVSKQVEPDKLDWEAIKDIGGRGVVLDDTGNVIKAYGEKAQKVSYSKNELMDLFDLRGSKETVFSYSTKDDNKLLMIYPKSVFSVTPSMDVNTVMGVKAKYFTWIFSLGLVIYLFLIFVITGRLSRRLKTDFELMRAEKDEREALFFRGLAHDIKTPLSTVIAYSKALEDGIVKEEEVENYYHSIHNNGIILKERVEDMLDLTTLGDKGMFSPVEGDILETIRRFIGDHYSWFRENNATINIEFADKDRFITSYDKKLFERLLENVLQNSVHHNDAGVHVFVKWDQRSKTLVIGDDGIGIPDHIQEHLWEPMVIGDESRTGENLRGMGLANVKRIVELHGWEIRYDGEFKVTFAL